MPPLAGSSLDGSSETYSAAPTHANFSPSSAAHSPALARQRSTILVHQKSPLLVATPPQITRVLAYSHPFLLSLNKAVGLLSWTTGDPWESFLFVCGFWAVTLYGDVVIRWAAPLIAVVLLISGMYARRYSPLSSAGQVDKGGKGHARKDSEGKIRHHKSLDEIVETMKLFTSRCNILLDPFLRLTDFLSIQRTATSATTRPALTVLLMRILLLTPVWYLLTLPPLYIITSKRFILVTGTLILSWHSRPARVSRVILWRSRFVRQTCSMLTGLDFALSLSDASASKPALPPRHLRNANDIAASLAATRIGSQDDKNVKPGSIRFSFTLFENQRRWIGIGWTSSMLTYERGSWTDDQLNPVKPKEDFKLPEVEGGLAQWRWVEGSIWQIEGVDETTVDKVTVHDANGDKTKSAVAVGKKKPVAARPSDVVDVGWTYFDNKWQDARPGADGWSRYTRRRKWYRDAELVEIVDAATTTTTRTKSHARNRSSASDALSVTTDNTISSDRPLAHEAHTSGVVDSARGSSRRSGGGIGGSNGSRWFNRKRSASKAGSSYSVDSSTTAGGGTDVGNHEYGDGGDGDGYVPMLHRGRQEAVPADWGVAEDMGMELG